MNKKPLNIFVFLGIMSTAILIIGGNMIFSNVLIKNILSVVQMILLLLFLAKFLQFILGTLKIKEFIKNIKSLEKTNLYSAIAISSALISILFSTNLVTYLGAFNLYIATILRILGLILGVIFVLVIPINLKFYSKIENVNGSWFIPPVGMFVIIISGSILGLKLGDFGNTMSLINLMLLGPAFILYLLTLGLVYFRSKFVGLNKSNIAPTFNIVLAPVAVSIIAMISTANLLNINNFLEISGFFFGYHKNIFTYIFMIRYMGIFVPNVIIHKNHQKSQKNTILRHMASIYIPNLSLFSCYN